MVCQLLLNLLQMSVSDCELSPLCQLSISSIEFCIDPYDVVSWWKRERMEPDRGSRADTDFNEETQIGRSARDV